MLLMSTELIGRWALRALELHLAQHVKHKEIWLTAGCVIRPAVWTVALFFGPVLDACSAVELVALAALDHVSGDHP